MSPASSYPHLNQLDRDSVLVFTDSGDSKESGYLPKVGLFTLHTHADAWTVEGASLHILQAVSRGSAAVSDRVQTSLCSPAAHCLLMSVLISERGRSVTVCGHFSKCQELLEPMFESLSTPSVLPSTFHYDDQERLDCLYSMSL